MPKTRTLPALKTLTVGATVGAVTSLTIALAHGHISWFQVAFTILAILLAGAALAEDIARTYRTARSRIARRRAISFRKRHGDPAGWDDDEYEAYWALTADQTSRPSIQTAA